MNKNKLRIGIIFGGNSREREISFAGGRTVYDNLNKSLFEAVPLFVDSFGNLVLLNWEYIYKGSIRDFYPSVNSLPESPNHFQVYAESLGAIKPDEQEKLMSCLGKRVPLFQLSDKIDFAFLCLHGKNGEDGRIQGLLEYIGIPYSGSGILSSAIGMNKAMQKELMKNAGFPGPGYFTVSREEWNNQESPSGLLTQIKNGISFPCVVKAANQGSSIGVSIVADESPGELSDALDKAFFIHRLHKKEWMKLSDEEKVSLIRKLADIREGIGMPLLLNTRHACEKIYHPELLLTRLNIALEQESEEVTLESCDAETEAIIEAFISGKEFSCIVIRKENGVPVALPPTEIRKGKEIFDYRSKYLPGLSRKITPINLPAEEIQAIRKECERLFLSLGFNVYARIDGFITGEGKIFLNDPNTTSGMMPSSFFFHQAAEIGLNPSQFLTYIIRTSFRERLTDMKSIDDLPNQLNELDSGILSLKKEERQKIKVAVILGGYSSERHISVESGRNIYEKLSSSEKYDPIPVFLTADPAAPEDHLLFQLPVNLLLKDNADDIREKVLQYEMHPEVKEIVRQCESITSKYTSSRNVLKPQLVTYAQLAEAVDEVFIALHGRPGEDGEVQRRLEQVGLPYNGSGVSSSLLTIDKYRTNEMLKQHGFSVAAHALVSADEWKESRGKWIENIGSRFSFPFIAKPADDGCSSAVKKIRTKAELEAFANLIFRNSDELLPAEASMLHLKLKEEFPRKQRFLIEELIEKKGADHFLEITGGLLTTISESGERMYHIFEASEALSEGDVLSLEEKFLAGEGQNITPARYNRDPDIRQVISEKVKAEFLRAAKLLNIEGYARIDAFIRIYNDERVEVIFIEVNSLPGMTPATCIFHQAAMDGYKPYEFIDEILEYGRQRKNTPEEIN